MEVLTKEQFNAIQLAMIKTALKQVECKVFVDVGAYNGGFSLPLAAEFPLVRFHLLEPDPVNYLVLSEASKGFSNVDIHRVAIGSHNGTVKLYVADNRKSLGSSQANSVFRTFLSEKDWVTDVKQEVVSCMTLGSFCRLESIRSVCVLKINCEGGEYELFSSGDVSILGSCHLLSLQLHGKCKTFQTPLFQKKRKTIDECLTVFGMEMVSEFTKGIEKDHIRQVWLRNVSGCFS